MEWAGGMLQVQYCDILFCRVVLDCGWSEPAATSAPVQDEAIHAVLGMNQKHILFPCLGNFSAPFFAPKFSPPTYSPPPPTSLTSFLAHSISKARESSWAWVAPSFEETWDTRLEEGGEFNVEGMWRGESKRSDSSQMQKSKKKGKLPPFSAFFFFSMVFLFFSYTWEEENVEEKSFEIKRVEIGGQKQEPKVRRQSDSLKVSFVPSLHFFSFLWFFFFFSLLFKKKKDVWRKCLKQKGRSKNQKWKGKTGIERKVPSFFCIFFLLYGFFFPPFLLLEKKKMLGSIWNKRVEWEIEAGAKSERVEREFEGKLPPFSAFFFFYVFFSLFFFLLLEKKKMPRKNIWNRRAEVNGKSGMAKVRAKSERAERELKGKLLPFFAFLLFSMVFFFFY